MSRPRATSPSTEKSIPLKPTRMLPIKGTLDPTLLPTKALQMTARPAPEHGVLSRGVPVLESSVPHLLPNDMSGGTWVAFGFVLHSLTRFFQAGGKVKALQGRTFPVSCRKAVGVLGAAWGSKRTHELGEGFINLSTKLLTLRGDNGRVYLHAVLDGIELEEGTNTITGMTIHPKFAEILVKEGASFFVKSDLTRVLSQIKARVGTRPWVACYHINMSIRRLAPSKRWHASEETVYMWGKPSDAPVWADLDRRARFKMRAWLARVPETYNSSFSNYRYKIVRVKQKDGKWGFVCRGSREGVRLSTKTYIRETPKEIVQGGGLRS